MCFPGLWDVPAAGFSHSGTGALEERCPRPHRWHFSRLEPSEQADGAHGLQSPSAARPAPQSPAPLGRAPTEPRTVRARSGDPHTRLSPGRGPPNRTEPPRRPRHRAPLIPLHHPPHFGRHRRHGLVPQRLPFGHGCAHIRAGDDRRGSAHRTSPRPPMPRRGRVPGRSLRSAPRHAAPLPPASAALRRGRCLLIDCGRREGRGAAGRPGSAAIFGRRLPPPPPPPDIMAGGSRGAGSAEVRRCRPLP